MSPKKKETKEEVVETVEVVETPTVETKETKETSSGFSVKDPEVIMPKELPLIITPDSGSWANEAQAEYARTLNGYAYKNPEKWKVKKEVLLKALEDMATDPSVLIRKRGNIDPNKRVEYGNKLGS